MLTVSVFPSANIFMEGDIMLRNTTFVFLGLFGSLLFLCFDNSREYYISSTSIFVVIAILILLARDICHFIPHCIILLTFVILIVLFGKYAINFTWFTIFLSFFVFVECLICIMQLLGVQIYNNENFTFTGTFDNPNAIGLFLTLCLPFVISLFKCKRCLTLFGIVALSIICILLSGSRASIICTFITILYMCDKRRTFKNRRFFIIIILILLVFLIFNFKYTSSIGHLLITIVTLSMLNDMPIYGFGLWGFSKKYMQHQADFLSLYKSDILNTVADSPLHPLNEYLYYISNTGYYGMAALFLVICSFIKNCHAKNDPYNSCILTLTIASCFSHPFKYAFTWILAIVCISRPCFNKYNYTIGHIKRIFIILLVCAMTGLFSRYIIFELKWHKAYRSALINGVDDSIIEDYTKLAKSWNGNPMFLYNYAVLLNVNNDYIESNKILSQYSRYYTDYYCVILKGNNYYNLDEYNKALRQYLYAHKMCPNRFEPLRGIMLSFKASGQVKQSIQTANIILRKKEKVPSYKTQVIKHEAARLLQDETKKDIIQ